MAFLEQTFCGPRAHPAHRRHQQAARQVLKSLLSESGGDIKGSMRSHSELLQISGLRRPFGRIPALLHILDAELRLISPTDPAGLESSSSGSNRSGTSGTITSRTIIWFPPCGSGSRGSRRKTRSARRADPGERAAAGPRARPLTRSLRSGNGCRSRRFAPHRAKSQPESHRRLVQAARRHYWGEPVAVCLAIIALGWAAQVHFAQSSAQALVRTIAGRQHARCPANHQGNSVASPSADPLLRQLLASAARQPAEQTRAAMALCPSIRPCSRDWKSGC